MNSFNPTAHMAYVPRDIAVADRPLVAVARSSRQTAIEYKTLAFVRDNRVASMAYEIKRARAFFDPDLGPSGGYRCPIGTRYGGQITDRFGRNCGWGVARRLTNAIVDAGERVEGRLDKRRERRVGKRNARVARRLGVSGYTLPKKPGLATRMDGIADRLDPNATRTPDKRKPGKRKRRGTNPRKPGIATRMEGAADRLDGGQDRKPGKRKRRGVATRMEDLADRIDGSDKPEKPKRKRRGVATRMEDAADRVDGGDGKLPSPKPARPRRPVPRRRTDRNQSVVEQSTNKPRVPSANGDQPAGKPSQRPKRKQGPFFNPDEMSTKQRADLDRELEKERVALEAEWRKRLGGEPTADAMDSYIAQRVDRGTKPGYIARLRSMRDDYLAFDDKDNDESLINRLRPTRRKRVAERAGLLEKRSAKKPAPKPESAKPDPKPESVKPDPKPDADIPDDPDGPNASNPSEPDGDIPESSTEPPPRKPARGLLPMLKDAAKAKLGRRNRQGYGGVPQQVKVGNKGIDSQDKANDALANGADMADIPDDYLAKAIAANAPSDNAQLGVSMDGKRFILEGRPNGQNVNGLWMYKDIVTGKRVGVKFREGRSYGVQEDYNEFIGAHIAERFGFAGGVYRAAGPVNPTGDGKGVRPIVFELSDNIVGQFRPGAGNDWDIATKDKVRATLLDFAIINSDRHGGNFFVRLHNNELKFIPIDHGLGFNGRVDAKFNAGQRGASEEGFKGWMKHRLGGNRNGMASSLAIEIRSVEGRERVRAEIQALQKELRLQERRYKLADAIDEVHGLDENRSPITADGRNHKDAVKRIKWLINADPDIIMDALANQP